MTIEQIARISNRAVCAYLQEAGETNVQAKPWEELCEKQRTESCYHIEAMISGIEASTEELSEIPSVQRMAKTWKEMGIPQSQANCCSIVYGIVTALMPFLEKDAETERAMSV